MINEMETTTSLILSANQPSMIGGTYPTPLLQIWGEMAVIRPPFFWLG